MKKLFLKMRPFQISFRKRLLTAFFMIAIPIMLVACVACGFLVYSNNMQSIYSDQNVSMNELSSELKNMISETEALSKDMVFNNAVQEMLSEYAKGNAYPSDMDVSYYVFNFIGDRDYIDSVVLTSTDQTLFSSERAYSDISSFDAIEQKVWYQEIVTEQKKSGWFSTDAGPMFCRSIYDIKDYVTLRGYVMFYLNQDYINTILDSSFDDTTHEMYVTNSSGEIVFTNRTDRTDEFLSQDYPEIKSISSPEKIRLEEDSYIVSSYSLPNSEWTCYMLTPYSEVAIPLGSYLFIMLFISGAIVLIFLLVAYYCASEMAFPISKLAEIMDNYRQVGVSKANMKERYGSDLKQFGQLPDEVGTMYRSYTHMIDRMDTLIEEIYVKSLEKKDAELALLQSQINPHFLYNTLNSINWLALANDQEEISEMITSLSDTFRLSLTRTTSSFVQLSQEVAYIKSYLVLQKFRYMDRLNYEINVDETLTGYWIPKFILQPIIENAINHGIDHLEDGGMIRLSGEISEDALLLHITNDGDGIDLDKMKKMLYFNPETMEYLSFQNEGYGIQNIHRRICIICGMDYGLSYSYDESFDPIHTICTIRLPLKEHDEAEPTSK